MEDLYNEVNEILVKNRITEFRNRPVSKKYAFELTDVPRESDYLEVLYPFSSIFCSSLLLILEPQLPSDLEGKTFSRIFGTSTALFERFVLDRKVMGPCWLQIVDPDFTKAQNVNTHPKHQELTSSQHGPVLNLEWHHQTKSLHRRHNPPPLP
jgi:DNA polymerase alpha subunit A